nr:CoA transferase subunit A [Histidinibacterium lentulum]
MRDGDLVFVGGFGQGVPFAIAREIARQGLSDLVLCRTGADILFDVLHASGCVKGAIFGWLGNPGIGISHVLRRAVADGSVEIEETSNFGLLLRLHAGALGIPFLPTRSLGLGEIANQAPGSHKPVLCPFTGEQMTAVSALTPDVAIVHAHRADKAGNVQLFGIAGDTLEGANAARRIVCTVEEIVDPAEIRRTADRTILPAARVAAVCHTPLGAHPSYMTGLYDRDDDAYMAFDELSRDVAQLRTFLEETIHACPDHASYVSRFVPTALRSGARGAGVPA